MNVFYASSSFVRRWHRSTNVLTVSNSSPGISTSGPAAWRRAGLFAAGQAGRRFREPFSGKFREECLNADWFLSLNDARLKCEAWGGITMRSIRTARSATKPRSRAFELRSGMPDRTQKQPGDSHSKETRTSLHSYPERFPAVRIFGFRRVSQPSVPNRAGDNDEGSGVPGQGDSQVPPIAAGFRLP